MIKPQWVPNYNLENSIDVCSALKQRLHCIPFPSITSEKEGCISVGRWFVHSTTEVKSVIDYISAARAGGAVEYRVAMLDKDIDKDVSRNKNIVSL